MFYAAILSNLGDNLFSILYREFPICFALQFLSNLSNNLSYIICRNFAVCFASVFSAVLNHIFAPYTYKKFPIQYWTKCSLNWPKKTCEKPKFFFSKRCLIQ